MNSRLQFRFYLSVAERGGTAVRRGGPTRLTEAGGFVGLGGPGRTGWSEAPEVTRVDGVAGRTGWPGPPNRLTAAAFPGEVFSLHLKHRIYYSKTTIGGISHEQ